MAKEYYLVQVDRPLGVNTLELESYIEDSVNSCMGGLPPEDPLFDMEKTCRAKRLTKQRLECLVQELANGN